MSLADVRRRRGSSELDAERNLVEDHTPSNLQGDKLNIAVLLFLYLLQGIPLGLTSAIPLILQGKGVSFKQQAEFSFAVWPFSLKLLWAPLVDCLYFRSFGRRKSWLVPAQYLIGIFMITLSGYIEGWIQGGEEGESQVLLITVLFFLMNFLAATQDIAVDGWALSMLKRENIAYASTCNSVGQMAGYFIGYVIFISLESASFCNSYLRTTPQPYGIVDLQGFLYFWGLMYVVVTTLIAIFKSESETEQTEGTGSVAIESYKQLIRILKLPTIKLMIIILLTSKIAFAPSDGVTGLKLLENGVPKEQLATMAIFMIPLQIVLPIFISKYSNSRRPMDLYVKVYPYRLFYNVVAMLLVSMTPYLLGSDGTVPLHNSIFLVVILSAHQAVTNIMFVQSMAFYAKISDSSYGGTYMTLLNTVSNLGAQWSSTAALWAIDFLTHKSCSTDPLNTCSSQHLSHVCEEGGGKCNVWFDGFYTETVICTIFGLLWFRWGKRTIVSLQMKPQTAWSPR